MRSVLVLVVLGLILVPPDDTCRLHSYELQVSQGARRGGFGKTLMQCLCDIARERGMQKVMLTVFKGDEIQLSFRLAMFTRSGS